MAGLNTGTPIVQVFHEKSRILPDVARVLACLYEKDINFKRQALTRAFSNCRCLVFLIAAFFLPSSNCLKNVR
jgi:hypothetical protein